MSSNKNNIANQKSDNNETVKVVIRCRPLSKKEMEAGHDVIVKMNTKTGEIFVNKPQADEPPKQFTFDMAFDWTIAQKDIYDRCAGNIIENVLEGYNGTIFAYGQTGTGKTHTMTGAESDPVEKGIMPRSFDDVFKRIEGDSEQTQFLIRASYLEIYNEEIRDLLSKNPRNKLDLHEKTDSGVYVRDLSFFAVKSTEEINDVLRIGMKNRSVGATNMNAVSSRSHSLFQITIERSELGADGKQHIRAGKLNMVDLAGSERIAKTGATGDRLKEATKINLSLSTLCHVISALTDPKSTYVPYRDSKLTRLLQDSLGGNTKTLMISNVGPADYNFDETMNTLRYASRAKNIKNKPKINEDPKDALLREYQDEITKLREQLALLNNGVDPADIMSKKGVMGGTNIVERIVKVEDTEKMKEFEEKLEQEKKEIKRKAEEEKSDIENNAKLQQEEKKKLISEIRKREEAEEKAKSKQQKLISRLKKMEEKMVVGSQAIEVAKQQQKELKKTQKALKKEQQAQADLEEKLKKQESDFLNAQHKFNSIQEELDFKSKKLETLWLQYNEAQEMLNSAQEDFDRERNDMFDTIYELTNQLKLKNIICENFIPPDEYKKYEKVTVWNEDINDWNINHPAKFQGVVKKESKRPQSAVGLKRPTSEYSRIAKGLGDLNPRYKFDNILQLDLDMPERTTEDYEGVPSMKVQQAIQAILQEEVRGESIPINTLINFNDSVLEEAAREEAASRTTASAGSQRPKSGKRPKSAKKKKVAEII